jgi:hypothetical protein
MFISVSFLCFVMIMIFYYFSENFMEYTFNNISAYHVFPNKLNFKLKILVLGSSSVAYIEIFLMASNPNIRVGDMYYIQLQQAQYDYYGSRMFYNYGSQRCTLRKCISDNKDHVTIHNDLQRFGCECIIYDVSTSVNLKLWINLIFLLLEVMCPDKFIT